MYVFLFVCLYINRKTDMYMNKSTDVYINEITDTMVSLTKNTFCCSHYSIDLIF